MLRICLAVALLLTLVPTPARACATAPPIDASVDVVGEDAIIIWDPAKKQQQFIRRATFRSAVDDFGFLVPTPSVPQLDEADDALFGRLSAYIDPGEVRVNAYEVGWTLCGAFMLGADRASGDFDEPVQVLAEARVAGFDVASLKATDPDALAKWLQDHGYDFRPALRSWLRDYIDQGWIINAFKVGRSSDRELVGSKAVRMTFSAEQPYFPYREPEDSRAHYGRRLRVFLFTPDRYGADPVGEAKPAHLDHATGLPGLDRSGFEGVGEGWWLQVFTDDSARRPPGGDLTFSPKPGPEVRLSPRPIEHTVMIPIFLDVLAFVGLLLYLFLRFRRRRPSPTQL